MKGVFILLMILLAFPMPASSETIQIIGQDKVILQEPGLVSWEVIDNNLREYKIFMDGDLVGKDFFDLPDDVGKSYSYNISIMIDVMGEFTLLLTVADYDGNIAEFATDVTVSKIEPQPTSLPAWSLFVAVFVLASIRKRRKPRI